MYTRVCLHFTVNKYKQIEIGTECLPESIMPCGPELLLSPLCGVLLSCVMQCRLMSLYCCAMLCYALLHVVFCCADDGCAGADLSPDGGVRGQAE